MTKKLAEPSTRSGKRIAPSPTKTTPIKKLFRYNCPLAMCLDCQVRLQGKCDCYLSFEYSPSEGSSLMKLAIVAEQEQALAIVAERELRAKRKSEEDRAA